MTAIADDLAREMGKHTPGPWRACGSDRGGCVCHMVWSTTADQNVATALDARAPVACVHGDWGDGPENIYGSVPPDEAKANARLIALAPTLLSQRDRLADAAERVLPVLDWLCGDLSNNDSWMVYPEGAAQLRADLAAVLFDVRRGSE